MNTPLGSYDSSSTDSGLPRAISTSSVTSRFDAAGTFAGYLRRAYR